MNDLAGLNDGMLCAEIITALFLEMLRPLRYFQQEKNSLAMQIAN